MFKKIALISVCFAGCFFSASYASLANNHTDYAAILNDPSNGLDLLETAQTDLYSIQPTLTKMMDIASQAASGTYSPSQLLFLDEKFQALKKSIEQRLLTMTVTDSLIFNNGTLTIVKNDHSQVIDLSPKDAAALGISKDDIFTISNATQAIADLDAAIDKLNNWLSSNDEAHHSSQAMSAHANKAPYFDSAVLSIKTSQGADSALASLNEVKNKILMELNAMRENAVKASSNVLSQSDRGTLNTLFQAQMMEIDRIAASTNFAIKAFDGGTLAVHDNQNIVRTFDLPFLNTKILGIANADLLSNQSAMTALDHIKMVRDQISIWLATGNYK